MQKNWYIIPANRWDVAHGPYDTYNEARGVAMSKFGEFSLVKLDPQYAVHNYDIAES